MSGNWQRLLRGTPAQRFNAVLIGLLIAASGALTWALAGRTRVDPGYVAIIAGVIGVAVGTVSWRLWRPQPANGPVGEESPGSADRRRMNAKRDYLVPRVLPATPTTFVGRDDEMKKLVYALDVHESDRPFVAVIHGRGGIGKTALALNFAHYIGDRFPDGQIFVRVAEWDSGPRADEAASPVAGTDPRIRIARELYLALRRPGERIPEQPRQLIAGYKRLSAGQRLVIVLDDVPEHATLPPLAHINPHSAIIITARHEPRDVVTDVPLARADVVISLGSLGPEAALTLLRHGVGNRDSEQQGEPFKELADSCNGEPLALTLAAAALASRPNWKLSLARDLISRGGKHPASRAGLPGAEPLDAIYQLLTSDEQYALRCIGVIGRARFAEWALQATLGDDDGDQTHALASGLTRTGLIARTSTGPGGVSVYEVAEPVVAYARRIAMRADEGESDLRQAQYRLNLQREERRQEKAVQRIRKEVYPRMRAGELNEALKRARDALALARDNPDKRAEAVCFAALAELYAELGEISAAEDAAGHAARMGFADSKARALRSRARLRRRARQLAEAEEFLGEALRLAMDAGDLGEEIRIRAERALVRGQGGLFDDAKTDSLTAVLISRQAELRQLPLALLAHGGVYLYQGSSDAATGEERRAYFSEAQEIFAYAYREAEDAQGDLAKQFLNMSWIRHAQARTALEQGDLRKAALWANDATSSFADMRHRYGVAHCRLLLARISLRLDEPGEAIGELLSALETFRNCGDARISADVSLELAQAYLRSGKRAEARQLQQSAVNSYLQLRDQVMARTAAVAFLSGLLGRVRRRQAPADPATPSLG